MLGSGFGRPEAAATPRHGVQISHFWVVMNIRSQKSQKVVMTLLRRARTGDSKERVCVALHTLPDLVSYVSYTISDTRLVPGTQMVESSN